MACKESRFNDLLYMLERNYPYYPTTFSTCRKCGVGSARGSGICAACVEQDLNELVGARLAAELHKTIRDKHAVICACMEA